MKLNLDYYKEDIVFNKLNTENEIIGYINDNKGDYSDIITNNLSVENLIAFSDIRKNIISWYPIKEESSILEIGANYGELTGILCEKAKRVISVEFSKSKGEAISKRYNDKNNLEVMVGNLKDIKFNEKFDYIALIGSFEYAPLIYKSNNSHENLLIYLSSLLKEDGKILIATDNKFGMRNWSVFNKDDSCLKTESVNSSKSEDKPQLLSKSKIENIIRKTNLKEYKFYYPLPDFRFANVFFTDEFLPKNNNLHRNLSLFYDSEVINFHENSGFSEIIKENQKLFPFYANSYFIEIGNTINDSINYISYWNNRNQKYKLRTIIKNDKVYKTADNSLSVSHIEQMKKNIDILKNQKINTLDSYNENTIISEFCTNVRSFDSVIIEKYKESGLEEAIKLIQKFYSEVLAKLNIENKEDNIFKKLDIECDKELIEELHFTKQGLWDLNFQNSFYIDNEFYVYDQEWILEDIPVEFILYRGLVIFDELNKLVNIDEILKRLDLLKFKQLFEKLELIVSENILDNKIKNFYLRPIPNVRGLIINNSKLEDDLKHKDKEIKDKNEEIEKLKNELNEKNKILETITNSKSWKITEPLRNINGHFKKRG